MFPQRNKENTTPHAIRIHETGSSDQVRWEEVEIGSLGPGEVIVRNTAIGVNFIDTYHRNGLYPVPLPATLGMEGAGVPVVYDGIGKETFSDSLDCLRSFGLMVSYGNASGAVPPINIGVLAQKGSLSLTRPTLMAYTAKREDLVKSARELFAVVKKEAVKVAINQTYPLKEAVQAHRDLEARKTTGSIILLP